MLNMSPKEAQLVARLAGSVAVLMEIHEDADDWRPEMIEELKEAKSVASDLGVPLPDSVPTILRRFDEELIAPYHRRGAGN